MIIVSEKDLRVQCSDASLDEASEILSKLEIELKKSKIPGIGLAAPQIGIEKNVCIIRLDKHNINLVNPKIIEKYDLSEFHGEGCLSFPDRYETTMRYNEIVVQNDIEPKSFICTGLLAVVIQHECDHFSGRLLPDFAVKKENN